MFDEDIKDLVKKMYEAWEEILEEKKRTMDFTNVKVNTNITPIYEAKPMREKIKFMKIINADEEEEKKLNKYLKEGYTIRSALTVKDYGLIILCKWEEIGNEEI